MVAILFYINKLYTQLSEIPFFKKRNDYRLKCAFIYIMLFYILKFPILIYFFASDSCLIKIYFITLLCGIMTLYKYNTINRIIA